VTKDDIIENLSNITTSMMENEEEEREEWTA